MVEMDGRELTSLHSRERQDKNAMVPFAIQYHILHNRIGYPPGTSEAWMAEQREQFEAAVFNIQRQKNLGFLQNWSPDSGRSEPTLADLHKLDDVLRAAGIKVTWTKPSGRRAAAGKSTIENFVASRGKDDAAGGDNE